MHRHARRIWMSKQIIMSNSFHMFSTFSIYRYIQATLIILLSSMKSLGNHGFDARHTSSASLFSGATTSATMLIVLFPPYRMKCIKEFVTYFYDWNTLNNMKCISNALFAFQLLTSSLVSLCDVMSELMIGIPSMNHDIFAANKIKFQ